jgi:hypothetical protein
MPSPRLLAVVTAMLMIAGAAGGQQGASLGDLERIESFIQSKDCGGLWSFVTTQPGLLEGNDPLARELRVFVASTERGLLDCFASRGGAVAADANDVVVPPLS